jgi:hypothetical protein
VSIDTTCAACGVPKPSCCYCYTGTDGTTCQPCHRDAMHNRRAARERTPQKRAERLRRTNKLLATHPEEYADRIANSLERSGS